LCAIARHNPPIIEIIMSSTKPSLLTRDQTVWREGREAARKRLTKKDNPYASGTADHRAWNKGFKGE
jgi:hypothetical protein